MYPPKENIWFPASFCWQTKPWIPWFRGLVWAGLTELDRPQQGVSNGCEGRGWKIPSKFRSFFCASQIPSKFKHCFVCQTWHAGVGYLKNLESSRMPTISWGPQRSGHREANAPETRIWRYIVQGPGSRRIHDLVVWPIFRISRFMAFLWRLP